MGQRAVGRAQPLRRPGQRRLQRAATAQHGVEQAKRGAASTAVADMIKPPEWWHSTRIIQAFDSVLQDKVRSCAVVVWTR